MTALAFFRAHHALALKSEENMKLFSLLVLFLDLTLASHSGQVVEEELFIVHLPDGRTMTHFQFSVQWDMHPLILVQDFKG